MTGVDLASPQRAPTIYDVAATAGVSHTTVSRALNGEDGMTAQTRARILELASRMGYRPNPSARVLAGRVRPQIAAVVVGGENSRRSALLIDALARTARSRGYALTIVGVRPRSGAANATAERIGEPGIRGVIVVADRTGDPCAAALMAAAPSTVPVVVVEDRMPRPGGDSAGALEVAVAHLRDLGHRAIAVAVGAPPKASPPGPGPRGPESGSIVRVRAGSSADAGFRLVSRAGLPDHVTALVAPTISFAIGAVRGFRVRGIRVPDDVSVLALEDHPDAAHLSPSLTTVSADPEELGRGAVGALIGAIEESSRPWCAPVTPQLVLRRSTAPVRAAPIVPR